MGTWALLGGSSATGFGSRADVGHIPAVVLKGLKVKLGTFGLGIGGPGISVNHSRF